MVNQVLELLWAGSGDSGANATIGFFSGRGFHDYFTAGNNTKQCNVDSKYISYQVIFYFLQKDS